MISHPCWMAIMAAEHRNHRQAVLEAEWLNWEDWESDTIITQDGQNVRLVIMTARNPGHGALTRLVDGIERAGLVPVLVEPTDRLKEWCRKRGWRARMIGRGKDRHSVFYPRPRHD